MAYPISPFRKQTEEIGPAIAASGFGFDKAHQHGQIVFGTEQLPEFVQESDAGMESGRVHGPQCLHLIAEVLDLFPPLVEVPIPVADGNPAHPLATPLVGAGNPRGYGLEPTWQ